MYMFTSFHRGLQSPGLCLPIYLELSAHRYNFRKYFISYSYLDNKVYTFAII